MKNNLLDNKSSIQDEIKLPTWMKLCALLLFVMTLIPLGVYICRFKDTYWSDKPGDWGVFGDYIGGTLNPILAIIGLFVTLSLAYIAKQADKASIKRREMEVRPLARIALGDYKNVIEVKIENAGLGPLIIESIIVSDSNGIEKLSVIAWFQNEELGFITWDEYVGDSSGFIISPGKELVLLRLTNDPKKENDPIYYRDRVRAKLNSLNITVFCKDIYGNNLPAQIRSLEWFGRSIYPEKWRG